MQSVLKIRRRRGTLKILLPIGNARIAHISSSASVSVSDSIDSRSLSLRQYRHSQPVSPQAQALFRSLCPRCLVRDVVVHFAGPLRPRPRCWLLLDVPSRARVFLASFASSTSLHVHEVQRQSLLLRRSLSLSRSVLMAQKIVQKHSSKHSLMYWARTSRRRRQ